MGSPSHPLSLPSYPTCLPIRTLSSPQRLLACRQLELFCLNWLRRVSDLQARGKRGLPGLLWPPSLLPLLSWTCLRPRAPSRLACRQCPERESSKALLSTCCSLRNGIRRKPTRRAEALSAVCRTLPCASLVLCGWHAGHGGLGRRQHVPEPRGDRRQGRDPGCPGYPPSPLVVFPTHVPGCQMEVKPGNPKTGIELSPSVLLPAFSNMTHLPRGPTPSISASKKSQTPWHLSSLFPWICP